MTLRCRNCSESSISSPHGLISYRRYHGYVFLGLRKVELEVPDFVLPTVRWHLDTRDGPRLQ